MYLAWFISSCLCVSGYVCLYPTTLESVIGFSCNLGRELSTFLFFSHQYQHGTFRGSEMGTMLMPFYVCSRNLVQKELQKYAAFEFFNFILVESKTITW
jgi:hypothetical protein